MAVADEAVDFGTLATPAERLPFEAGRDGERVRLSWAGLFVLLAAAVTAFRLLILLRGGLPLFPEEAQYWDWSRRLDWGYYSKPPLIALLIRLSTSVFGSTEFGVRFPTVVLGLGVGVFAFRLTRELFASERLAFAASALLAVLPLYCAGGLVMVTDTPLLFFWAGAVWAVSRAIFRRQPAAWIAAGVCLGLGLAAKLSMVLLVPCLLLFLLVSREHRFWLRRREPYVGAALGALLLAPYVLWNSTRSWVSFRHLSGQGRLAEMWRFQPAELLRFLGSQALVISPLLFVALLWSAYRLLGRERKELSDRLAFLLCLSAPILLLFIAQSLRAKVQANWAGLAYFAWVPFAVAVFARWLKQDARTSRGRWLTAFAVSALAVAVGASAFLHRPDVVRELGFDLPSQLDPMAGAVGWDRVGEAAGRLRASMPRPARTFLFGPQYQVAAELAFYVPGKPRTYCVPVKRRMNQYDLWGGFPEKTGWDAVYVARGAWPLPKEVVSGFRRCEPPERLAVFLQGKRYAEFTLARCYGFHGSFPEIPSRPERF